MKDTIRDIESEPREEPIMEIREESARGMR